MGKRGRYALVAGVVAAAVVIALLVDWRKVGEIMLSADRRLILLLPLFELGFYFFNNLAFYSIVRGRIGLRDAVGANMLGWLADTLIPLAYVEGDAVRAYVVSRKAGWSSGIAVAAVFRFTGALAFFTFLLIGSSVAFAEGMLPPQYTAVVALVLALSALAALVLGLSVYRWGVAKSLLERLLGPLARRGFLKEEEVVEWLSRIGGEIRAFRKLGRVAAAYVLQVAQWLVALLEPYTALMSVGARVSLGGLASGYTLLAVASMASIGIPFMTGAMDVALTGLFTALGASLEQAVAATVLTRVVSISVSTTLMYLLGAYYAASIVGSRSLREVKKWVMRLVNEVRGK